MPEVTVKYKNSKSLKALEDLAKLFDMVIETRDEKKKNDRPPMRFAKKPNVTASAGIWKDNPDDQRIKAWGKGL